MKLQEDLARILIFYLEDYINDSDKNINNFYEKYDNDDAFSNSLEVLNSVIYIYRETINIFKKIINLNGNLLSFDCKYFFTIFMLLIEIKKMDNDQIAKLDLLDRNIFLTKTKNKQYLEEKKALSDNLKLMYEKCIELHTQGTTDPNRKKERTKLIKNFIN